VKVYIFTIISHVTVAPAHLPRAIIYGGNSRGTSVLSVSLTIRLQTHSHRWLFKS